MNRRTRRRVRIGAHSASDIRARNIKIALICLLCVIILIVVTVIWGNSLKRRADNVGESTSSSSNSSGQLQPPSDNITPVTKYDTSTVPTVKSKYITLSSSAGINWGDRAASLMKDGTTAVSLVLYYGDNIVNYSSSVAQAMGYQTAGGVGKTDLYEACSLLSVAQIRTDGCFYQSFSAKQSPAVSKVFRAYESALVAEALDEGFSDVTIFGFSADIDGAKLANNFVSEVRELTGRGLIGIALPASVASAADRDLILAYYASVCDYLAIDFSSITATQELSTAIGRVASLSKTYNLRIMVSNAVSGVENILIEAGCTNWQIVPN